MINIIWGRQFPHWVLLPSVRQNSPHVRATAGSSIRSAVTASWLSRSQSVWHAHTIMLLPAPARLYGRPRSVCGASTWDSLAINLLSAYIVCGGANLVWRDIVTRLRRG